MIQVSLDTSFLISFADPTRPNHSIAVDYFRHCLAKQIPMWISVVAAGEFEVGQPVTDLPLQNFRIQPYNLQHAIRAAAFLKALRNDTNDHPDDRRPNIVNAVKILAQAAEDQIPLVLTEDASTLSRKAKRLAALREISIHVLLLTEGFNPGRLENPDQGELPLAPKSK